MANVRLVTCLGGRLFRQEFSSAGVGVIAAMEVRGFEFSGELVDNPALRDELQNMPKFVGLLGPMWDGDAIRYESQEAYNALTLGD